MKVLLIRKEHKNETKAEHIEMNIEGTARRQVETGPVEDNVLILQPNKVTITRSGTNP
jgi:hypothetical protein